MSNKLIYVDNSTIGSVHELFNATSLKMFSEIYDEVIYYTSRSVKKNTFRIIQNKTINVRYKFLPIIHWDDKGGYFLSSFFSMLTSCYVIFKSSKKDIIFFNYTVLWAFPAINILTKILNRKIILMFHGELEYLYKPFPLNSVSKKALEKLKSEKFTPPKGMYFCVLGESIKRNIATYVSTKVNKKIISFEHSLINTEQIKLNKVNDGIIRIGCIGELRKEKGILENILKISNLLKLKQNIKLLCIGRVYYDKNILTQEGIEIVSDSDTRSLTRTEMDNAISKLDYILFVNPEDSYKLRASGALYDAIDNEKPILSLKNDYFNEIFTQNKDIGHLFENEKELVKFINNIDYSNLNLDLLIKTNDYLFVLLQ